MRGRPITFFHLHLVSDATGETLNAIAKAACAQFESAQPIEHSYVLVRSARQLDAVMQEIADAPGIVLFTLVENDLRNQLVQFCTERSIPCVPVLDGILALFEAYLGLTGAHKPGRQHQLDSEYFARMEALNFTMAHDDGQHLDDLEQADVVLLGVSRTSKTPTCIYLANRGVKAANVPLVPGVAPPEQLSRLRRPLIVGLIASPERLMQIRRARLLSLSQEDETDYTNLASIREEMTAARRLYERLDCAVIDVTRRSIEETAASILDLHIRRELRV